jgi:hypothetical protein
MPTLRELAAAAHAAEAQAKADAQLAADNATLKALAEGVLGSEFAPVNNRLTVDDLTFMAFDGRLLLVFTCPKCGREVKGRRDITNLATLHRAAEETLPAHPPCDFYAKSKPEDV